MRFNYILKDATVGAAIAVAASMLNLKLDMVTPDNTKPNDHIIIPPSLNLSELIKYLQVTDGYGIYNHGCSAT